MLYFVGGNLDGDTTAFDECTAIIYVREDCLQ